MTFIQYLRRLNAIDWLLISYITITGCFILVFYPSIPGAGYHLLFRGVLLILAALLLFVDIAKLTPLPYFFRIAYPLVLLGFFYSETDALNNVFFQNQDKYFARLDATIFGFQPSLEFYKSMPSAWFSELMNFSYFSYYFLIAVYTIYIFIHHRTKFIYTVFVITCSFLLYYLFFIAVPVSGPQYFFEPPHNQIADSGIFRRLVLLVEYIGERPTAAFPSSHVGMVLILLLLSFSGHLKTWIWLLPLFLLLSFSTVYIKAHYAVDVIGGILSAPVVLWLSKYAYNRMRQHSVTDTTINRI